MKLSIVCDRWDEKGGGCEQYLAGLASHTLSMGIKVDVYASQIENFSCDSNDFNLFHMGRLTVFARKLTHSRLKLHTLNASEEPILAVRPFYGATHYQFHSGLYRASFQAERESLPSRTRRSWYPLAQKLNVKRQRLMRNQDRCLKNSDRPKLMVFSLLTALELREFYGIGTEEIRINPHGVNLTRFSPPINGHDTKAERGEGNDKGGKSNFLFVAHNFFLKGLHCIFEAIGRLHKMSVDVSLQIAGKGPEGCFERLAEKLGIRSQIHFLGHVSQDHLCQLYQKSVALVHPTFYDPCSLVVLEALACGCPVVTTRNNGAAELIRSGREGFVLDDPRNIEALCDSLQTFQDPNRSEEMGRAASELAPRLDIHQHMAETMKWLGLSSG
jgi:UDP-glucose:(heptosyl)LPS alpha-1,3-glucosyltransferase